MGVTGHPQQRHPGLTPRERRVLGLMAGTVEGHRRTVEQVASRFGVSEQTILRILASAKKKLN
jgi:DNA-directed RNA polymerase sigma subunit (sigma70/sigma32)